MASRSILLSWLTLKWKLDSVQLLIVDILSLFFYCNRKIKTNYFIVSLAFADLLVSVLVMPFGAIELVHQHWIYGETFCLVRTSLDVLLTTASILHLCCIALDRWGCCVYFVLRTMHIYCLKSHNCIAFSFFSAVKR